MIALVIIFMVGIALGALLVNSKVALPEKMLHQLQGQDHTILITFLAYIAASLCLFSILSYTEHLVIDAFSFNPMQAGVGGILMGLGIVLCKAMPISIIPKMAMGYTYAWFACGGAIVGCMAYHLLAKYQLFQLATNIQVPAMHSLLGIPFWLLALILATALIAYGLLRRRQAKSASLGH